MASDSNLNEASLHYFVSRTNSGSRGCSSHSGLGRYEQVKAAYHRSRLLHSDALAHERDAIVWCRCAGMGKEGWKGRKERKRKREGKQGKEDE